MYCVCCLSLEIIILWEQELCAKEKYCGQIGNTKEM